MRISPVRARIGIVRLGVDTWYTGQCLTYGRHSTNVGGRGVGMTYLVTVETNVCDV